MIHTLHCCTAHVVLQQKYVLHLSCCNFELKQGHPKVSYFIQNYVHDGVLIGFMLFSLHFLKVVGHDVQVKGYNSASANKQPRGLLSVKISTEGTQ